MKRLILFGAPGSGKGTQGSLLERDFGYPRISTGDLIREEIRRQSEIGKKASNYASQGRLVPDELVMSLVQKRLGQTDINTGYILDGFPRTLPQAELVTTLPVQSEKAIYLEVSEEQVSKRLGQRLTCASCGTVFNLASLPPRHSGNCDQCGGVLEKRSDDDPETIARRIQVYEQETKPVIEYYRSRGNLSVVDASGAIAEVYEKVKKAIS